MQSVNPPKVDLCRHGQVRDPGQRPCPDPCPLLCLAGQVAAWVPCRGPLLEDPQKEGHPCLGAHCSQKQNVNFAKVDTFESGNDAMLCFLNASHDATTDL